MKTPLRIIFLPTSIAVATFLIGCADTHSTPPPTGYRTGQELTELPRNSRTETIDGTRYYSHNGTYYKDSNDRFVVVDPPRGKNRNEESYVDRLPPGYHMKRYSGEDYFVVGDTYYKQLGAGYVIVDRPF